MAEKNADGKKLAAQLARKGGKPFHRPVSTVRSRLGAVASGKGFAEPDVLLRWTEAVGERLSEICQPVRVVYGASIGATLVVRADGPRALEVEHQAPHILERINAFYGYKAISRLRVTQATGQRGNPRGFAETASTFQGKAMDVRAPKPEAEARAARLTADIESPDLRAALTKMGAWVLSKPAPISDKEPSR
ncbi:MAG: DciA family protein [Pseudomonadota bacterium]